MKNELQRFNNRFDQAEAYETIRNLLDGSLEIIELEEVKKYRKEKSLKDLYDSK